VFGVQAEKAAKELPHSKNGFPEPRTLNTPLVKGRFARGLILAPTDLHFCESG
jgi:hypothetical protein